MTKINDMTDEEKLQKKRDYHREYMKNRRATDEVFANKERERNNTHKKHLYETNPEFKEKVKLYNKEKSRENVSYKAKYVELLEQMNLKL
jgi:hypothetical protein